MKEGHGTTILDSKDIDKDCTCGLWTKSSLFGKAEFDIKANVKDNRAMFDAAVSGRCIVTKLASVLGPMHLTFGSVSFSLTNSLQLGVFSLAERLASGWSLYNNFERMRDMDGNNPSKVTMTFSHNVL